MANYMVNVPLVIATDSVGRHEYLYGGSIVPDSLAPEEVDRLKEGGFVVELPAAPKPPAPKK